MPDFRVAVVGCGQVSRHHFLAWQRCTGARVVAVCDPVLERAAGRAKEFGIDPAAAYDNVDRLFADARFDLVDIISPRETHADLVRLAARHGVHALCEKPLCPTLAEARSLVDDIGNTIRVMVNENWRYRHYYTRIGEWIRDGRLGTIVHMRVALWRSNMLRNAEGAVPSLMRQPFAAREQRLLVAESLIHELDVTRSLLGPVEVVAARIARASDHIIGEDTAVVLLQTPSGPTVTIEGVLVAAGHIDRAGDRLEIAGTRCSVILDNAVLRLIGAEQEEHVFDEDEQRQGCFDTTIQHFIDCMIRGAPFWTSAEDQLQTLKLVEDIYRLSGPLRTLVP